MWGALRGVVNSVCNAGRDPFVSVADVLGIVVSATWCGTGCLVEPNYHGGARYRPPAHPQVHMLECPTCPMCLRQGTDGAVCGKGLMGRLRQGAGGRRVAVCVSQVLTCVTCMVRPR